ncbi:MAG: FapA family protein, partial [Planctomycetota bacterium]
MADESENRIRVRFSTDRISADLVIAPGTDPDAVTEQEVLGVVLSRGIPDDDELRDRIAAAVAAYDSASTGAFEHLIAQGRRPQTGENGWFELEASLQEIRDRASRTGSTRRGQGVDTKRSSDQESIEEPSETVNHYDRSTLMVVRAEQMIGQLHPAKPGLNGVDALGETVPAKDGHECSLKLDEASLITDDSGRVSAAFPGLVVMDAHTLKITRALEIHHAVDFSTGHVNFRGDIDIRKGVCDMFRVTAGRSLRVGGTVEAADLCSGYDTTLERGMTGREKGSVRTGRDLHAR